VAALAAATVAWGGSRWLILRPVRALVRAAERVRAGDLQVRTGLRHDPTEFGSLAGAFDGMVEALRAREAELAAAYDTTLEGWSRALDLRDRETGGHTLRVTALAVELARAMGMPEEQIVHLRRGALLHDIGKMAIPDEILHKPGPLTPEEMAVMRRHPQYAYELLWPIEYLRPALDIPYCHHERWDGGGYPRGLRGEEIPLAARIFAVVDVWDALSSERPYRPAWPPEQVRAYLRAEAGRQFDPTVVEVFLRLLDARGET
jgi:putative nucleotidyltransferase with HDIG domain